MFNSVTIEKLSNLYHTTCRRFWNTHLFHLHCASFLNSSSPNQTTFIKYHIPYYSQQLHFANKLLDLADQDPILEIKIKDLIYQPVNKGEDIEHGGHIWVIVSRGLLQVFQGLFAEGHSHLVPALGGVLDHQVVERPEAGRDLVTSLLSGSCCSTAVTRLDWRHKKQKKRSETGLKINIYLTNWECFIYVLLFFSLLWSQSTQNFSLFQWTMHN